MVFSSPEFLFLFLPVVFTGWLLLARLGRGFSNGWLLAASLSYYGWGNPAFTPLLACSLLFNFAAGAAITRAGTRRNVLLAWAVAANLALLCVFKYLDFFTSLVNGLGNTDLPLLHLPLPLGISFFTFIQIAYLADVGRGEAPVENLHGYALFVAFFPQLLAGPIVLGREMRSQHADQGNGLLNWDNVSTGLFVLALGLFKKTVLADPLGQWVAAGFDQAQYLSGLEAWTSALAYTLQIYFDFSGYADMAVGTALLFNIRLPANFHSPYKSADISEFWRRWHITLGRWLREYLYIPLGGGRAGLARTLRNLAVVMFLAGLWHGAALRFVAWGLLHGAALAVHRIWRKFGRPLPRLVGQTLTFGFVAFAWVPFRAQSLEDTLKVWRGMFLGGPSGVQANPSPAIFLAYLRRACEILLDRSVGLAAPTNVEALPFVVLGLVIVFLTPNSMQRIGFVETGGVTPWPQLRLSHALCSGLALATGIVCMLASSGSEFIYFKF